MKELIFMQNNFSVTDMPKTATFQMRINPEVKRQAENIFSQCGMTLTDAINIFIQQSINAEGLPFLITKNSKSALKNQAVSYLLNELKKGETDNWISESDVLKELDETL